MEFDVSLGRKGERSVNIIVRMRMRKAIKASGTMENNTRTEASKATLALRFIRYSSKATTSAYAQNGHLAKSNPDLSKLSAAVLSSSECRTSGGRIANNNS